MPTDNLIERMNCFQHNTKFAASPPGLASLCIRVYGSVGLAEFNEAKAIALTTPKASRGVQLTPSLRIGITNIFLPEARSGMMMATTMSGFRSTPIRRRRSPVPELSTWALLMLGFSAMGMMLTRRARIVKTA